MVRLRLRLAAAVLALGLGASPASAQYAGNPFFDWTVAQSQAIGFELAAIRIDVVDALGLRPPYPLQFINIVEQMARNDFARFGGTLAERDRELAFNVHFALAAFEDFLEDGDGNVEQLAPIARGLLAAARDVVLEPALRDSLPFKGGVLAQLLLGAYGVAEGYQDALIDIWSYSVGWAALQRVKVLWEEIAPFATPTRQSEATQLLGILDELYPTVVPPIPFAGRNPDEAEAPAQLLVGIIEEVVQASLFSARSLPVLAAHLIDLIAPICPALEVGDDALVAERIYAAFDHYGELTGLSMLIGLLDPEVDAHARALFAVFVIPDPDLPRLPPRPDVDRYRPDLACPALVDVLTEAAYLLQG